MRSAKIPATVLLLTLLGHRAFAEVPAAPKGVDQGSEPARAVVVPPKLLGDPSIPYPEDGRGDATVVVVLVVERDGSVSDARAETSNPPFSSAAESWVRTLRFEPARARGTAVAAKIKLEIVFEEPEPEEPAPDREPPSEPAPGSALTDVPRTESTTPRPREDPIEVTIRDAPPEPSRTATFSRAEVRQIPGTFGDPFRAIEAMPGVTPIVSGLPFFFVRGAPPGNVGYFLDGIAVPLLFHVGVGPSVVHPGLIDRVDLYPGGYPARFGRFAGGIVAGETVREESELHGEYNLRLFDAGAMAETGLAGGRGSVLLGGRYSYTAALLSAFSPETTLDYWDYQARASYRLTPRDTLSAFAFGSYDFVGEKTETGDITLFGTEFHRLDLRYDHDVDERAALRTALTVGLDQSLAQEDRSVRKRVAGMRTEYDVAAARGVLVRAGTDLEVGRYDVVLGTADLSPSAERVAEYFPSRTDLAAAIRGDVVLDVGPRLTVTPGVRVDAFASEGAVAWAVDPRLSLRTRVTPRLELLTALGIAHQPPAFVVPLPGFQPGGLRGGLQRAVQESFGAELDLGDGMAFTATVFQNAFFDMSDPLGSTAPLPSGCAPGTFPEDTLAGDRGTISGNPPPCGPRFRPGVLGPDRSGGGGQAADSRGAERRASAFEVRTMGSAYGVELFLKRRLTKKLGGFLAYTLSRSLRSYENREYIAAFDRTHVANAALAYDLGRNWRAGTRVVFYTGLPQAATAGDPSAPGTQASRLPSFFRVDLRLEKRWQLGQSTWISAVAEWMNATLSEEAVATTCTLAGCEAQMVGPITIPSIGVEGGF